MSDTLPTETILDDLAAGEAAIPISDLRNRSFVAPASDGKRRDKATIYRWALKGISKVKLETMRGPSGLFTTQRAYFRFLSALNAGNPTRQPTATPARRRKQIEHARQELRMAGIGG